ncbi:MAG: hypothetical protein AAF556_07455, partial [Pseudomonadota bacterium]
VSPFISFDKMVYKKDVFLRSVRPVFKIWENYHSKCIDKVSQDRQMLADFLNSMSAQLSSTLITLAMNYKNDKYEYEEEVRLKSVISVNEPKKIFDDVILFPSSGNVIINLQPDDLDSIYLTGVSKASSEFFEDLCRQNGFENCSVVTV